MADTVTSALTRTYVVATQTTGTTSSQITRSFQVATQPVTAPPPAPGNPSVATPVPNLMLQRAWGQVQHLLVDTESDDLLAKLMSGLFAATDRLSLIAHGDGDTIGPWEAVTNPAKAPLWALPAAAQWTGGTMPTRSLTETDAQYLERARREVVRPKGMRRGSAQALLDVAKPYLTASASVQIVEQQGGDLWSVGFIARPGDITDTVALTAALNDPEVIPAGVKVFVNATSTSPSWDQATRSWDATTGDWDTSTISNVT